MVWYPVKDGFVTLVRFWGLNRVTGGTVMKKYLGLCITFILFTASAAGQEPATETQPFNWQAYNSKSSVIVDHDYFIRIIGLREGRVD